MKLSLNLFGCGWENRVKSKLRETNDETFWKCQKTYIFKKFKPAKITRGVDLILNQQQQILSQSSLLTLVHLCSPPPPAPPHPRSPKNLGRGMIIKRALLKTKSCGLFTWASDYFLIVFIQLNFSSLLSPISSQTTHLTLEARALPVRAVMKTLLTKLT